jgi:hypothetical protein
VIEMNSETSQFDALTARAMARTGVFGHREHVLVTWLAVREFGRRRAIDLVCEGIQRTARYAGAPQKYNATVSRAWVELISHHAAEGEGSDFDEFADRNPALFDKRLLMRFYRTTTLAAASARRGWVEPDLAPFPFEVPPATAPVIASGS